MILQKNKHRSHYSHTKAQRRKQRDFWRTNDRNGACPNFEFVRDVTMC